jgi:predicted DNA-binding transcriptional regulator YafY
VLDPSGWGGVGAGAPPFLDELRQAVIDGHQVRLDYADRSGTATTRIVHPLGVVKKGPTWYLVSETEAGQRTFRVGRVRGVEVLDEPAVKPPGFDLAAAWRAIVTEVEAKRLGVRATLRVPGWAIGYLRGGFGTALEVVGDVPGEEGTVEVVVGAGSVDGLARQMAGWAGDVEVVDPPELRAALVELGRSLVARHGG